MAVKARAKFAAEVDAELLSAVETLALAEGRDVATLVDEALSDLLAKHREDVGGGEVMDAYNSSHAKFAGLYKKLAE